MIRIDFELLSAGLISITVKQEFLSYFGLVFWFISLTIVHYWVMDKSQSTTKSSHRSLSQVTTSVTNLPYIVSERWGLMKTWAPSTSTHLSDISEQANKSSPGVHRAKFWEGLTRNYYDTWRTKFCIIWWSR